jgi:hypothetical protein
VWTLWRNLSCPRRESNPTSSALPPIDHHYTNWAIAAPNHVTKPWNSQSLSFIFLSSSSLTRHQNHTTFHSAWVEGKGTVVRMGEWMRIDPHFLDFGTSWCVVSFTPRPLYPRETAPSTHWTGGCVDPRTGLDDVEKRKFLNLPGLKLRTFGCPVHGQSLYRICCPGSYK